MIRKIIKNISNEYTVLSDNNRYILKPCGKFRYLSQTLKVGDDVEFNETTITKLLKRKNTLIRPYVSNVDYVIIVMSLKRPDISYELLDKFIVNIELENIKPIIIISKMDLASEEETKECIKNMEYYKKYYKVFYERYDGLENMDSFLNLVKGKISVVSGQTGAGKSHFLNKLDSSLSLKTQDISDALNRGKHTTRHTELLEISGAFIADTPGFSSLEIMSDNALVIKECFPDFVEHLNECKFNECSHVHEPSCKIKELVSSGDILKSRYDNYLKFYFEIKENTRSKYYNNGKK